VALFSIFGKKPQQSDDVPAENASAEQAVEDVVLRQSDSMQSRREAARKTAEKIDAIESEITRDILRNPASRKGAEAASHAKSPPQDDLEDSDYPSSNLFHTTLIRVDRETMIMFKEDMDE
jgi:hypothetical protein